MFSMDMFALRATNNGLTVIYIMAYIERRFLVGTEFICD